MKIYMERRKVSVSGFQLEQIEAASIINLKSSSSAAHSAASSDLMEVATSPSSSSSSSSTNGPLYELSELMAQLPIKRRRPKVLISIASCSKCALGAISKSSALDPSLPEAHAPFPEVPYLSHACRALERHFPKPHARFVPSGRSSTISRSSALDLHLPYTQTRLGR